jgi:Kef-type K+ transport system membrane component KefB
MTTLTVATVLIIATLVASMISVEIGLSVAVIEIVAGNTMHLATPDWLVFTASFGSVVLTFLAGAEVDPAALRRSWTASATIGTLSFAALLVLMWLGAKASSRAVLPAFLLGLAVSRSFARHRTTQQRFRVVAPSSRCWSAWSC